MSGDIERFGKRVKAVYCARCGESRGVWTDEKHRECWECGQSVYDDFETYLKVAEQMGGRFTAAGGGA